MRNAVLLREQQRDAVDGANAGTVVLKREAGPIDSWDWAVGTVGTGEHWPHPGRRSLNSVWLSPLETPSITHTLLSRDACQPLSASTRRRQQRLTSFLQLPRSRFLDDDDDDDDDVTIVVDSQERGPATSSK